MRKQKKCVKLESEKEQPPTRWVDLIVEAEKPPTHLAKVMRAVFSMIVYLQNVKTNVSNANIKRPKDNKS
mgnify:CR=1 FL=1